NALVAFQGIAYGLDILFKRTQSVIDFARMGPYGATGIDNAEDHKQGGDEHRPLLQKASHSTALFHKQNRVGPEVALEEHSQQPRSTRSRDRGAVTVANQNTLTDGRWGCQWGSIA